MSKTLLSQSDLEEVEKLTHEIREQTGISIVCVVLKQSDSHPLSHFRCALLGIFLMPLFFHFLPFFANQPLWILYTLMPLGIMGYLLPFFSSTLKRILSTHGEFTKEVQARAAQAFFAYDVHKTQEGKGMLLLVSLLERRIHMVAGHGIDNIAGKNEWKDIITTGQRQLKMNGLKKALTVVAKECGSIFKSP